MNDDLAKQNYRATAWIPPGTFRMLLTVAALTMFQMVGPWLALPDWLFTAISIVALVLLAAVWLRLRRARRLGAMIVPAPIELAPIISIPGGSLPDDPLPPPSREITSDSLVLVVDDDKINRIVHAGYLAKFFRHVATADDGEQALKLFDRDHPDALVLDLHMPGFSGYDVIRSIRLRERRNEEGRPTRLVVLTADVAIEAHKACLQAGADAVLLKPCYPADLILALQPKADLRVAS